MAKGVQRKLTVEVIAASAAQHQTRSDWKQADRSAYEAARERALLDVVCAHMTTVRRSLTLEQIRASAAKQTRRSDWKRADRSAYTAAAKQGLLDTVCAHMAPVPSSVPVPIEEIRASAAAHPSLQAWQRGDPTAYNAAKRQGLFDEVCGHMPASPGKLSLEALKTSAAPYDSRGDWKLADPSACLSARQRGLLDVVCAHMTPKLRPSDDWTLERCKESAAPYTSRVARSKGAQSAYGHACRNGWLDQCCAHMPRHRPKPKWTPENIAASAKYFRTKSAWHQLEHGAYWAAKRLGIFKQVTAHMPRRSPRGSQSADKARTADIPEPNPD